MAWQDVAIVAGSNVIMPNGEHGHVEQVGADGTARVMSDTGQRYQYPTDQLKNAEGEQGEGKPDEGKPMEPLTPENVKEGDRVKHKQHSKKLGEGEVTKVTQRSVYVKWEKEDEPIQYQKRYAHENLERIGETDQEELEKKKEEERQAEREARPVDEKSRDVADDLYGLFNLKDKLEQKIEDSVDGELKDLREMVKKNQELEVKVGDEVNVVKGLRHKQLEQLINYAALRLSPLLVGMAGTGKTHAGMQAAEALGLSFYSISVGAQTTKTDIMGYMDAGGRYIRTHFRDAYENGGVFLMDEIDAGNANVLITINAALSNGLAAFPDAMVNRHKDFIFIASANTFGNGANRQYVGRNQLDAATLDRFALIEWHIDDALEENLSSGINGKPWYKAVRAARDYVADKNIRALVSPRATQKGCQLLNIGCDVNEVIDATLLGSVPDDKKNDVREVATKVFEKFASDVKKELPPEVDQPSVGELLRDKMQAKAAAIEPVDSPF